MPFGRLYRPPWHRVLRLEGFIATRLEGRSFESWSELQPFADSATAALAAVHEAGVLHGDLRPKNFCHAGSQEDMVKLLDFDRAVSSASTTQLKAEKEALAEFLWG